jgi:PAS domain S-box-containing protein
MRRGVTDLVIMTQRRAQAGRTFAVVSCLVALAAIVFMASNVSQEIRLLGSANSDNVQWSLSQTEVEFLEFTKRLEMQPADLAELRRKFDIFYSRIATVDGATVFANLREDAGFRAELADIQKFLNDTVSTIDANDADLRKNLPALRREADRIRSTVRALSIGGLNLFAVASDIQRRAVVRTMTELAVALAILIGALAVAVLYLNRLNHAIIRRESLLTQTATRLNAIIATSLDGVIVSDRDGRIVTFSPAAEAIFGYLAEDVVGRDLGGVIVPQHLRAAHHAGMDRMRQGGVMRVVGKGRVRLEALRITGEVFPVEVSIHSTTMTDAGEIFIAFVRDISRLIADEAELVAARDTALANEKLKTEFLATMSHEIRTPLNGLLGNMDLLRDTSLSSQQARFVRNMDTSGRLLMRHISDVLDITRYDAGKMSIRAEPMNLSVLLQDIIDSQTSMAAANETTLEWGWNGSPQQWIKSDHDRLQHILLNLIGNAVKFTKRGKIRLTIQAEPDGDRIQLYVEINDTGPGIDADLSARVFDDFVTGNSAYDREVGGTGLGLSIAKRFVNALDGEIGVDSTLGEGSTFWVRLPVVVAEPTDVRSGQIPAIGAIRPMQVLVVEDNEINRTVARDMLEAGGHHVTEAGDGQQGVDLANTRQFDLILMDISMPVMDGRIATRAIRQGRGPSAQSPIVALTANAMREEQDNFITDGMNSILMKPLSKAALAVVLSNHQRPAPRSATPAIDHDHNAETREVLGHAGYTRLAERFANEVDNLLAGLTAASVDDLPALAAQSHKTAGSAAVFGAVALQESLRQIEIAAMAGDREKAAELISGLDAVWMRTRSALT